MDVDLWPSGLARFADGVLEVTLGDSIRVPVRDVMEIGAKPPKLGRPSLTLRYRSGLETIGKSWWVEPQETEALRVLVEAVQAARH
ncbi:MAG: hypothetical protein ABSA40_03220 [Candidatus Dormibacteria bacterium]|jgi:hypothetical protein